MADRQRRVCEDDGDERDFGAEGGFGMRGVAF